MQNEIIKEKLLTRRQVIDNWLASNPKFLRMFGCPNCRDLLFTFKKTKILNMKIGITGKYYYCHNKLCKNYNKEIEDVNHV